jgi:hypothetical protein
MFTEEALEFLREAVYHPRAERTYEMMSDSFIWSDERIWETMARYDWQVVRTLLGYRGSVIRGAPDIDQRRVWEQVSKSCPEWPGLRPERNSPTLAAELLRARRRACVQSLREMREMEREEQDF